MKMDGHAGGRPAGKIPGTSCDIFYIDYSFTETEHSSVSFHSFPAKTIIPLRLYLNLDLYTCPEVDGWPGLDPLSGFSGLSAPEESPSLDSQCLYTKTKLEFNQASHL